MPLMSSRPPYICDAAMHRSFMVNGIALHALEWGQRGRPALCFLHGGSAHAHWFDAVVPAFVDRFHVISLDQRGHGESGWAPDARYGTEEFASDLAGVMDRLGWKRMVVAGHSMGGHNSLGFAAWYPDRVRGLCVIDSRPSLPAERLQAMHRRGHRGPRRHETLEAALASFKLLPADTTATPDFLAHLGRQGITEREGRFLYRFDPQCNGARRPANGWALLPGIKAPTLLVRGELSPIMPAEMAQRMVAAIPSARLVTIPGAYHHLVLDTPEAFIHAFDAFLEELLD